MTITTLSDRAVVRVAGVDARAFLQGLLTNDMTLLAADRPLYAGLLSPQGKALFDLMLFADGDEILIDVASARAEALVRRLTMYRLRKAVTIALTPSLIVVAWGSDAAGQTADPRLAALGSRWVAADGPAADVAAYRAHRLGHGVPDTVDIGEDQLLWLETNADLLNGVSFTKGCYIGQENTARMHHRDRVRRRLVPIEIDGTPDDTEIRDAAGRSAGSLRSQSGAIGIAHLRLEAAAGSLTVGGRTATALRPDWLAPAFAIAGVA